MKIDLMGSRYTPILPLADPSSNSHKGPLKRKRENTRQACQRCRESKSKCDSGRPLCGPCIEKGRNCEYDFSQGGISRQSAMKARLDTLEDLFKQLQQSDEPKAQRLFKRLRSNAQVQTLLQDLGDEVGPDEEVETAEGFSSVTKQAQILSELAEDTEGMPNAKPIASKTPDKPVALHDATRIEEPTEILYEGIRLPSAAVTDAAVQNFFACSGTLLHVFSRQQAQEFLQEVFGGHTNSISWRPAVCCLCAIAAIGKAYDHSPSASATSKLYYETSKRLFETLMEHSSLDAMKLCVLLALYSIFDKATLAIIHIEVGMSLAKYFGLEQNRQLVNIPYEKWIDYRKSWRTLLFFKSWLCFTLGYMAGDDILAGNNLKLEDLEICSGDDMEDMIQTETAKISFLKARILRVDLTFSSVAARVVQSISQDLEEWLQGLPPPMRLEALRDGEDISDDHRRAIYYLHLLYQGSRMLIYRRILSQEFRQESGPITQSPSETDRMIMLGALRDGRRVADMTSHTLRILQAENGVFKRCWLVIFQAFTSCTLILYEAAQKQAHGMQQKAWRADLRMAEAPLSTLEFCATLDPVAHKFHGALLPFYKGMGPYEVLADDNTVCSAQLTPPSPRYLCELPTGDTALANRAQALRQLLCAPFGEPRQKVNHLEIEHLDWHLGSSIPFHWSFPLAEGANGNAVDISSQSNAFLGETKRPSGWASPPPGSIIIES